MPWLAWSERAEGSESEFLARVVSLNIKRRHLNESQRATIAAEVANKRLGDNQHKSRKGLQICTPSDTGVSVDQAAAALNVAPRTVYSARKVLRDGCEDLKQAVVSGEMSVTRAAKIADLPREEQPAAMAARA